MAQWQELLRLDSALQSRVSQLYEGRFPREVRHRLSVVIESQDWHTAAADENQARACFNALLVYLEEQWSRSVRDNNILQGPDFSGMRDFLLKHFQDQPLRLARTLSECLTEEKRFLDSASEAQVCSSPTPEQSWRQLDNKVNSLKTLYLGVKKESKSLEDLYEKLDSIQETWQFQVAQYDKLAQSLADVKAKCQKKANFLTRTAQLLLQQIMNTLKVAEEIVVTLTEEELPQWKRRQQMACIGSPVDTSLDLLQKWFTAVTEVLLEVREQLQKLRDQSKKYNYTDAPDLAGPMAETENFAMYLCTKLLSNALIVEKQPVMTGWPQRPLMLKTTVRFAASVRFLANLPKFKWLLNVKPAFDKGVEEERTVKGFRHFALSGDNAKVLDEDTPGEGLVAEFGNMLLNEIKERDKGVAKNHLKKLLVSEELHIIKFVTEFQYAGLKFDIEASTLPVVVVSSTNQFVWSWASIMWFNMVSTSEPWNLSLFANPPPLTWTQLSQVLSWQFLSVGQRELDENQLLVLKEKIVDSSDDLIPWRTFSKNDSAWVWIDGILDLIKKHLQDLWREGFIMGFVSRNRTRALLQEKQTGNFLLRFSESNKEGAITFSFVDHSSGEALVHAVEPYTKQELEAMCLPDVIQLYSFQFQGNICKNPLVYLYPDIPKDRAFGPYYKIFAKLKSELDKDGYKRKNFIPVTIYPTPPPSPPRQTRSAERDMDMDMDMDKNTFMDFQELVEELFPDLYDVNGHSDLFTFDMEQVETSFIDPSMSS